MAQTSDAPTVRQGSLGRQELWICTPGSLAWGHTGFSLAGSFLSMTLSLFPWYEKSPSQHADKIKL